MAERLTTAPTPRASEQPGYSRTRMASGGKMIFDVSPSVIDRDFAEAHPNVRQGPHALLTITEGKAADKRGGSFGLLYRLTEKEDAKAEVTSLDGGGSAGRHDDQNPPAVARRLTGAHRPPTSDPLFAAVTATVGEFRRSVLRISLTCSGENPSFSTSIC